MATPPFKRFLSGFRLVSNPRSKTIGGDLLVKVSRDHLAPTFVQDSLDIGVFAGSIAQDQRNNYQDALERIADEITEEENADERPELIMRAFFHLVGSITLDTFITLNAAMRSVTRTAIGVQDFFFVEWTQQTAWVLRIVEGFHEPMSKILRSKEIPWQKRFALLSFVADLPLEHMHESTPKVDEEACRSLRTACCAFLDELTELKLVHQRTAGSIQFGVPAIEPKASIPILFANSKQQFPSISIERRVSALKKLLATIDALKPTSSWDYRVEAPPIWQALGQRIKNSFQKKKKKRASKSTRKQK